MSTAGRTIATICARAGSKGLPGKNIRAFAGRPLIVHSIEQALACGRLDGVYVSTDSEEIAGVALAAGAQVPYLRPAELASDQAGKLPVIEHLVEHLESQGERVGRIVDLQPTSPLRTPGDIEAAMDLQEELVVSVRESADSPWFNLAEQGADGLLRLCKGNGSARRAGHAAGRGAEWLDLRVAAFGAGPRGRAGALERARRAPGHAALAFGRHRRPRGLRVRAVAARPPPQRAAAMSAVFVVAEAGVNHNGDLSMALQLCDAARAAGADAVKFQSFRADDLVVRGAPTAAYQARQTGERDQFEMLRRLELDESQHGELQDHCRRIGIEFFSTPFSEAAVDLLVSLGVQRLKMPSGELTHRALVQHAAATGLPVLLSTGMATLAEVQQALGGPRCARGLEGVTVMHCTSAYPAPDEALNLAAITTMQRELDAADRLLRPQPRHRGGTGGGGAWSGRDRKAPDAGPRLAGAGPRRLVGAGGVRRPGARHPSRRSHARRRRRRRRGPRSRTPPAWPAAAWSPRSTSPAGARIEAAMLACRRPATGIAPAERDQIVGRTARIPLPAGTVLQWDQLERRAMTRQVHVPDRHASRLRPDGGHALADRRHARAGPVGRGHRHAPEPRARPHRRRGARPADFASAANCRSTCSPAPAPAWPRGSRRCWRPDRVLERERPDLLLVLGDRGEMLAGAIAALHLGIPCVHLHGGERSGTVDEPVRHAISKLSAYHLVATEDSRQRLLRMGEEDRRIFVVGAPGLDGLRELAIEDRGQALRSLGLAEGSRFLLALFHPVVQQAHAAAQQTRALQQALSRMDLPVLWLDPNADAGSRAILDELSRDALPAGSRRLAALAASAASSPPCAIARCWSAIRLPASSRRPASARRS